MTFGQRARPEPATGIYLGKVARVVDDTAYVVVARLAADFEYPARYPDTGVDAGDVVAVSFLEGGSDELVVLVRLA